MYTNNYATFLQVTQCYTHLNIYLCVFKEILFIIYTNVYNVLFCFIFINNYYCYYYFFFLVLYKLLLLVRLLV